MKILIVLLLLAFSMAAETIPIIFDTDMGNDIDDALALAMLHALESRGECRLIAVTITKDNRWSAPYVDLVNTFYGRPKIPIGVVKGSGVTPDSDPLIQLPAERKDANGRFFYPHRITSGADAPDAVGVLRRVLAAEKDGSVIIVQVGFSTNLAKLLDSPADTELVSRKVKLLSVMAGNFAESKPEFNVEKDPASAQKLFLRWPTDIVVSGFEIGNAMRFPAARIESDFAYVPDHPIAEAYRAYKPMPYDRPTWDLTAVLFAVRPSMDYFSLSVPGKITPDSAGRTKFEPNPTGRHRHLILDATQRSRTLEAMILLASEPATEGKRHSH